MRMLRTAAAAAIASLYSCRVTSTWSQRGEWWSFIELQWSVPTTADHCGQNPDIAMIFSWQTGFYLVNKHIETDIFIVNGQIENC